MWLSQLFDLINVFDLVRWSVLEASIMFIAYVNLLWWSICVENVCVKLTKYYSVLFFFSSCIHKFHIPCTPSAQECSHILLNFLKKKKSFIYNDQCVPKTNNICLNVLEWIWILWMNCCWWLISHDGSDSTDCFIK